MFTLQCAFQKKTEPGKRSDHLVKLYIFSNEVKWRLADQNVVFSLSVYNFDSFPKYILILVFPQIYSVSFSGYILIMFSSQIYQNS